MNFSCFSTLFLLFPLVTSVRNSDYINGGHTELEKLIVDAACKDEPINDVLKLDLPENGGKLGQSIRAIVWRGISFK